MLTDPLFYLVAFPAVAIFGVSKGGFGQGLGLVTVPMLALVMSPVQAAAIMMPLLIAMDLVTVWAYRKSFDHAETLRLLPMAVVGTALGWAFASLVNEGHVRLVLGVVALAFVLDRWFGKRPVVVEAPRRPHPVAAWFWGTLGGFTSFVSHSGMVPLQLYLLPLKLEKTALIGTISMVFFAMNIMKLGPYWALGQFTLDNFLLAAVLVPVGVASTWLGVWLTRRVSERPFYRITYFCLFLVSLELLRAGFVATFL